MSSDFETLVRRPFRTETWPRTALVGTLLVATLPLVVPSVLLAGYVVRLLRRGSDDPLPTFADVRELARTGLFASAITLAYHLPALALFGALFVAVSSTLASPWAFPTVPAFRPTGFGALVRAAGPAAFVTVAVVPVCSYAAAIALTAFARTGDVADAFDSDRIRRLATSVGVCRAFLLAVLVTVVAGVVAGVVGRVGLVVPFVGGVAVGAVRFYGLVVAVAVWRAWLPAGRSTTAPAPDEGDAAPN
jgi:hypothetical protein